MIEVCWIKEKNMSDVLVKQVKPKATTSEETRWYVRKDKNGKTYYTDGKQIVYNGSHEIPPENPDWYKESIDDTVYHTPGIIYSGFYREETILVKLRDAICDAIKAIFKGVTIRFELKIGDSDCKKEG